AWAFTVLGLRWLAGAGGEAVQAVVAGSVVAFVVLLPKALPLETATGAPPMLSDWLWILYLGAIQIGLAYFLLTRGMAGVPAFEASLLLLVEPVLSPFWAYALHGERPTAGTVAGGALILLATIGRTLIDWRSRRADAPIEARP
ncbi:MAG: DMT family transporter, partial [Acidobacteriota bacterium]